MFLQAEGRCPPACPATQEALRRFARDAGIDLSPAAEALVPGVDKLDALLKHFGLGREPEPTRAGLVAVPG